MLAKIRFLKKIVINNKILKICDLNIRILIGKFLDVIYYVLPKKSYVKTEKCLLLMIGGLGDCLFHKNLIDNLLHNNFDIEIYIQQDYLEIFKEIYNNKKIQLNPYTFNTFLNINKYSNHLYISTNATIESYLFYKKSKAKYMLGYVSSYKRIISNFKLELENNNFSLNKRERLNTIIDILKLNELISEKITLNYKNISTENTILFSFLKSSKWGEVGNLSIDFQVNLITMISKKYNNHRLLYLGVKDQFNIVETIKNKLLMREIKIENLCGKIEPENLVNYIKVAKKIFTVDGGLLHLADFFNKDVVSFFNFSKSEVYSPKNAIVVNSFSNCSPCKPETFLPIDGYPIKCPNSLRCSFEYDTNHIWEKII